MAEKSYTVVYPVKHDGKSYKPGNSVKMEPEQAKELLDRGVLSDGKAKESNSGMADPIKGKPKEPEGKAKKKTDDPAKAQK